MKKYLGLIILLGIILFSFLFLVSTVEAKSTLRPYYVNDAQDLTFWLRSEFLYKADNGEYWQSPYETVQRHKGDCEDFAFLVQHIFHDLLTQAKVIVVTWKETKKAHAICVFKDKRGWSYFSNQYYHNVNEKSIEELIKKAYPNADEKFIYLHQFNKPFKEE